MTYEFEIKAHSFTEALTLARKTAEAFFGTVGFSLFPLRATNGVSAGSLGDLNPTPMYYETTWVAELR